MKFERAALKNSRALSNSLLVACLLLLVQCGSRPSPSKAVAVVEKEDPKKIEIPPVTDKKHEIDMNDFIYVPPNRTDEVHRCNDSHPEQIYRNFVENIPYYSRGEIFSKNDEDPILSAKTNFPLLCNSKNINTTESERYVQVYKGYSFVLIPKINWISLENLKRTSILKPLPYEHTYSSIAYTSPEFWEDFYYLPTFERPDLGILLMSKRGNSPEGHRLGGVYFPDKDLILVNPLFGHSYLVHELVHREQFVLKKWSANKNAPRLLWSNNENTETCEEKMTNALQEIEASLSESETFQYWGEDLIHVLPELNQKKNHFEMNKVIYLQEYTNHLRKEAETLESPRSECSERIRMAAKTLADELSTPPKKLANELSKQLMLFLKIQSQMNTEKCEYEHQKLVCVNYQNQMKAILNNKNLYKIREITANLKKIESELIDAFNRFIQKINTNEREFVCSRLVRLNKILECQ